jgi:hypothetical protein
MSSNSLETQEAHSVCFASVCRGIVLNTLPLKEGIAEPNNHEQLHKSVSEREVRYLNVSIWSEERALCRTDCKVCSLLLMMPRALAKYAAQKIPNSIRSREHYLRSGMISQAILVCESARDPRVPSSQALCAGPAEHTTCCS